MGFPVQRVGDAGGGSWGYLNLPQTGWLQQQRFISQSSGGWDVQDQGPGRFGVYEGPLHGLHMATFLLCPHMGFPPSLCLHIKPLILSLSWPHLNLTTSQRHHLQTPSHWGFGLYTTWELVGDTSVQSIERMVTAEGHRTHRRIIVTNPSLRAKYSLPSLNPYSNPEEVVFFSFPCYR